MVFTIGGFGILIGNPVAGALLGDGENWMPLQVFCASAVTCAAVFTILTRIAKVGTHFRAKA